MSGDDPIANVSRGWGRRAQATGVGAPAAGFSAALWTEAGGEPQEVAARPNEATHAIAFTASPFEAEVSIDGRPVFSGVVPAGGCNLVQPGQAPRGVLKGPWRLLHVYLPDRTLRRMMQEDGRRLPRGALELENPGWSVQPRLRCIARSLAAELTSPQPLGRLKMDSLGTLLAVELLRRHSTAGSTPATVGPRGLASWQVKRACDAMDARLDADLALADLAAAVGLSATHFSRAFKVATGMAPFHWLQARRLEKAKGLLEDSRLSLAEVALACGFSAQPAFTTAFRRAVGATPGAWRRDRAR